MATVYELISQILRRLDEVDPLNPVHWTRSEILVHVNDAISELNLITWELQGTGNATINSTENIYDYPASILAAIAIRVGKYLQRSTVEDIDKEAKWELDSEKRLNVRTWAPIGLNMFLIHPRPLSAQTAEIEGLIEHTPVTDAAIPLPVRTEYESAIEDFCVERAKFKEGPSEMGQASSLYGDFLNSIQRCSGRNVIRLYPRFSKGIVTDESLREKVEGGE